MDLKTKANIIESFIYSEGWTIYESELKKEFDKEYSKLRKCPKDSMFYKIRGKLDALEYALNLPSIIINRGELK